MIGVVDSSTNLLYWYSFNKFGIFGNWSIPKYVAIFVSSLVLFCVWFSC